jgi:hypothetical protein
MNGDHTERLPQKGECRENGEGGILESASTFAHRVLKEIEALAGTSACKSVQLVRLKKWAQEQGCWFDDHTLFGDFFDRGSENEVYLSPDGTEIIKLNDFRYSDDNLTPFLTIYYRNSYCHRTRNTRRVYPSWFPFGGRWRILHQQSSRDL